MEDLHTLISSIDYKVRKLLDDKRKLENSIDGLLTEKQKLDKIVSEQSQEIINLKEQIKILKLGEAVKSNSDITEVKLKINNLVRKIDKCVGMITKTEQ
ncbi:MAG: hypothetical protein WCS10_03240 [Bacteroidales bacterium]|jgi:chromosome segregation ATPase|nr:hypothetical protein [Bacteroidales bacterium]MDD4001460.1 hypothetical protein [Bacteroidales bacterium]MDD4529196.1 hypothetical protein [Bacteroidales bacterium]